MESPNFNNDCTTIIAATFNPRNDGEAGEEEEQEEHTQEQTDNSKGHPLPSPTGTLRWPIRPHLIFGFVRSGILRLWPYCHIHGCLAQPSPNHPAASRYWIISANDPNAFGPSLEASYLSSFARRGIQWQRFSRFPATLAWNGFRNACNNIKFHQSTKKSKEGPNMLNLAERKWPLGLLFDQLSFNVPQRWMSHVQFEENYPADYTI
ncbi:hypothetical protein TWF506_010871 [Arthrobotrys conoides]|uniref:Uncharacterized protein n=1 Tax=Arthrobotrys conoides TaxID=74498 RepID=A0AAN8NPI6_9PEZI